MSATTYLNHLLGTLKPVRATEEIEFLVKELDVMTGQLGRKFVIASADRIVYLVSRHLDAFQVQRLDQLDNPICTFTLLPEEFDAHSLGDALRAGQLFTLTVLL